MHVKPKCPGCRSDDTYTRHIYGHGNAHECNQCGRMWGWYYDRNLPENKMKSMPAGGG